MHKHSKEIQENLRIIGQMAKMPHKPHEPFKRKQKITKGKGRLRAGKSGS